MMNFKKALFAAVAMSAVTACSSTWDVDAVKNMETKGSAFDKALKHEYTELAAAERDEHDWADTAMFLERAKAAADGASPAPEAVTARKIKEKYAEEVRVARERLVRTLDAGTRVTAPADSASAQAGYECWTQELEEDIQPDDIKSCRDKFDAAMNVIERAVITSYSIHYTKLYDFASKVRGRPSKIRPESMGGLGASDIPRE